MTDSQNAAEDTVIPDAAAASSTADAPNMHEDALVHTRSAVCCDLNSDATSSEKVASSVGADDSGVDKNAILEDTSDTTTATEATTKANLTEIKNELIDREQLDKPSSIPFPIETTEHVIVETPAVDCATDIAPHVTANVEVTGNALKNETSEISPSSVCRDFQSMASALDSAPTPTEDSAAKPNGERISAADDSVSEVEGSKRSDAHLSSPRSTSVEKDSIAGVVSPYADFVSQQSAQIRHAKEKEREARRSLNNPTRTSPLMNSDELALQKNTILMESGIVAPFADFQSQQSAQIKAHKAREREARMSLNQPAKAPTSPYSPSTEAGTIAAFSDFQSQQSALIKESKRKEREARKSLNQLSKPCSNAAQSDEGTVAAFADFQSQQSAQLRSAKEKEKEARQSLNRPSSIVPSAGTRTTEEGSVAAFSDFQAQQSANIKKAKEKEREARQSLNQPAAPTAIADDFASQQKAMANVRREKERETRDELSRIVPDVCDATTRMASELKLRDDEQRRKKKEAADLAQSYRHGDSTAGDAGSRMAAELKRQGQQQKLKKKEAEDMVSSYRQNGAITSDAASRTAASLSAQREEQKRKKKEAEQLASSYRHADLGGTDATSRIAADLSAQRDEQKRKKKEATEMASSYRHSDLRSGDAASQTAASLTDLRNEQKRKKKEAEELAQNYRNCGTANAQERLAADLKQRQDAEKQKKKEAHAAATALMKNMGGVVCSPGTLDDLKSRRSDELKILEEERKRLQIDLDEGLFEQSTDTVDVFKSRTADELAALHDQSLSTKTRSDDYAKSLQSSDKKLSNIHEELAVLKSSGSSLKDRTQGFTKGLEGSKLELIKSQQATELKKLKSCGKSMKARANELEKDIETRQTKSTLDADLTSLMSSGQSMKDRAEQIKLRMGTNSGVEKIKSQQNEELTALKSNKGSLKERAEEFRRSQQSPTLTSLKSRKDAELASLRGNSLKDMAETFQNNANQSKALGMLKTKTETELHALKNGTMQSDQNSSPTSTEHQNTVLLDIKSKTADELANLKGRSLRDLTSEFKKNTKSPKLDKIKSQQAEELAAVQVEQARRRAEQAAADAVSTANDTSSTEATQSFTEEELAVFEQERKSRALELESFKEFSSTKKLDAHRSKAAAELAAVANRRKQEGTSKKAASRVSAIIADQVLQTTDLQ